MMMMMTYHNFCGGDIIARGAGIVWLLLILLHCGGVSCYKDSLFDYISFQETGEWNKAYAQTCRGKSADGFREPRYLQYPEQLRPPWEAKSPVSINTKDVIRKEDDNVTLHIFNNVGERGIYSVSYGFQRDKECIHGQDKECIVEKTFGSVRALVLNAERFPPGQGLNFLKDHFLNEEAEQHVTILNGGSLNERKFYEAVFLGGYVPKALQGRGKSSHVIDGKSYPLEIYMYFVDETVPSMSLATILVVLVEESERENPFIKPIVAAVQHKLLKNERKFLHSNGGLQRTEHQFHNVGPSFKYDLFGKAKKKSEKQLRQEMLAASANLEEDLTGHLEIFERMQALASQLVFLDEDLLKAQQGINTAAFIVNNFQSRLPSGVPLPTDHDELFSIGWLTVFLGNIESRYELYNGYLGGKPLWNLITSQEWNDWRLYDALKENQYLLDLEWLHSSFEFLEILSDTLRQSLIDEHRQQISNLTFHVVVHGQKVVNWELANRDASYMKNISLAGKYRRIKQVQDLEKERRLLNQDVYDHFFGNESLHQRASHEWGVKNAVPNFDNIESSSTVEENKHRIVDSIIILLIENFKFYDYQRVLGEMDAGIKTLIKDNNFPDGATLRRVLIHHKFGYKDLNKREQRNYVHDAFFNDYLPSVEKRAAPVEMGNMEMPKNEREEAMNANPLKVTVDEAFQVSWLIPPNGGYYYYSGSSPVPPCHRAQNVIVFKKPITMSRSQIEVLTRVPISLDKKWDIVHTTPVLHDNQFRVRMKSTAAKDVRYEEITVPIYNQPRNHLFLGHDGVHKNAVEESEKREMKARLRLAAGSGTLGGQRGIIWGWILIYNIFI